MTSDKENIYARNANDLKHIREYMAAKQKEAMKQYKSEHPEQAEKVGYRIGGMPFIRKKGGANVLRDLVDRICWRVYVGKTQKSILEEVQQQHPNFAIQNNIWNRELVPWQMELVQKRARGQGVEPEVFKGCKTLAQIRKAIHAHYTGEKATARATVKVSIDDKHVVIGKNKHPIQKRKSAKYNYSAIRVTTSNGKRHWIRVDALEELLLK